MIPSSLQRTAAGSGVLPQRLGRLADGLEPGRHRVGAPFVLDAQFPDVRQQVPDLLPLAMPLRIEGSPQTLEGASQP